MRSLLLALLVFVAVAARGQAQQEINEQVWKPFIRSFNEHDSKAFLDLHSKDVVRSPRDAKVVWNWSEYLAQQKKGDENDQKNKSKRSLELRFTERLSSGDQAIDVGVYKTTYTDENGKSTSFYGRFHVVHRRENGVWKILVDTDSSEGDTIDEQDFLAAKPLEK